MSTGLRKLQENFQSYILDQNDTVLRAISSAQADAIERIQIYKVGYALRLLEVLEKDFPLLRKRMGEELFHKIGHEYIKSYPSDNFSICRFSRHFSNFLLASGYEALWSEMATFEWALACALDAADGPYIGLTELSSISPESWPNVQFDFHPSAKVYQFQFNAPQIIYAMMLEEDAIPEVVYYDQPANWIIWRYNRQSYFESLTAEQLWVVNAIQDGKTFAEICEGLCQWLPEEEVAAFAAGSLRNWLEKNLFSAVRISETATI